MFERLDEDLRALLRRALASSLRAVVLRRAADPVFVAVRLELDDDLGRIIDTAEVAPHRVARARRTHVVPPRRLVVERIGDGVEDARLADPGLTGDQEQPVSVEGAEVDVLPVLEGSESLDRDGADPHPS
ncbi:MAG: hypothetical protein R2717_08015 [Schumannella sp.]